MAIKQPEPHNINIPIVSKDGLATREFSMFLQEIYEKAKADILSNDTVLTSVSDVSIELNQTQAGSGLAVDGQYVQSSISNYINGATSLNDATLLLDAEIKNNTVGIVSTTADYVALSETAVILGDATSLNILITLPDAATTFYTSRSNKITLCKTDASANTVTLGTSLSQTIGGAATVALSAQNDSVSVISNGTNWYIIK